MVANLLLTGRLLSGAANVGDRVISALIVYCRSPKPKMRKPLQDRPCFSALVGSFTLESQEIQGVHIES